MTHSTPTCPWRVFRNVGL